jgi:MFS family permease
MLPGNIALRALGPNKTIALACISFGTVVCGLSQAHNYATVMGLRVLVGIGEAFIQGGGLYLSVWYSRHELGTRAGMYLSLHHIALSIRQLECL